MNYEHVFVAIIAGGQGTRLFPISHTMRPKQFCRVDSERTFLQSVIDNFSEIGIKKTQIIIITTNDRQSELAKEQAVPRGVLSQNIRQIDPDFGYAGAMVKATRFIKKLDPEAIVINTPADQYLVPGEEFATAIEHAVEEAENDNAVIIGVKVSDIVIAMGCGHAVYTPEPGAKTFSVEGFIEKPKKKKADALMRADNSACNTGINVWRAEMLTKALEGIAIKGLGTDTLMSALGRLRVAVGTFEWKDCGTLKALYEISKKTPNHKNASVGTGTFERIDCRRSMFYASTGMELRVAGATDDAIVLTTIDEHPVLVVVKMAEAQKIKLLAEDFYENKDFLANEFGNNNMVLRSNLDDLRVGFVGVENYAVYAHRETDGRIVAAVSQLRTR